MKRTLDLFTGSALPPQKKAKSGSKASKPRELTPRTISGVCFYCKKAFTPDDLYAALPMLAGWLHYQCYVDKSQLEHQDAKRTRRLEQLQPVAA